MKTIYAIQEPVAREMRRRRIRQVLALIERCVRELGRCNVLDVGGEGRYWDLIDPSLIRRPEIRITLANREADRASHPGFDSLECDACDIPREDFSYDFVHSNSVVEHVGDWFRMKAFAREIRRLAPVYYVQTPYYYFPVEPHFSALGFHWRSPQARTRALLRRPHGPAPKARDVDHAMRMVEHARLLDKPQFRALFPDAEHTVERVLGITKSLIAIRREAPH